MKKIQVTQQQRDNALDALNNMWPSVPEKNVVPGLNSFGGYDWVVNGMAHYDPYGSARRDASPCNSAGCFGGWCSLWPNFQAQGVGSMNDANWMPVIRKQGGITASGFNVAQVLFGDVRLFLQRGPRERGTIHEVVTKRLQNLIANSEVKA